MHSSEGSNPDFVFEHPLSYINFNAKPSQLKGSAKNYQNEDELGLVIDDKDPIKFSLRLEADIPGDKRLHVSAFRKLMGDLPLVWQPDINDALRRHLQGEDSSVKPDEHDKYNYVVLPEGARVGAVLLARGAIDRLVTNTTPWGEVSPLPSLSSLKFHVDRYNQIVESEMMARSRQGIMAAVSVGEIPLALYRTFGDMGHHDPRFQEIYRPFATLRSAVKEHALIDINNFDIFTINKDLPDEYGIVVGKEPITINVNIFEGIEDLLAKKTNYFKGFIPEKLHHHPNSDTSRCPACGMVGMDQSNYNFGEEELKLSHREIRPGTANLIGEINLTIVTPEIAGQALNGRPVRSCDGSYPAACCDLHLNHLDSITPYPCHDFVNNNFCEDHLPHLEMLPLQTFPDEIREKIIRKELGEVGVKHERYFHRQ
jgi:hypothetical protein